MMHLYATSRWCQFTSFCATPRGSRSEYPMRPEPSQHGPRQISITISPQLCAFTRRYWRPVHPRATFSIPAGVGGRQRGYYLLIPASGECVMLCRVTDISSLPQKQVRRRRPNAMSPLDVRAGNGVHNDNASFIGCRRVVFIHHHLSILPQITSCSTIRYTYSWSRRTFVRSRRLP